MEIVTVAPEGFPQTHWSVLSRIRRASGDERRASMEELASLYWRPVYACFRLGWRQTREQAEDLTQEFFVALLDGKLLDRAGPNRGRFRNFVRACLDNFMRNWLRTARRLRRGGGRRALSIEFGESPDAFLLPASDETPEVVLDRHWKKAVLDQAIERLRASARPAVFDVFSRYDLAPATARPTYVALAKELGVAASDVDNWLSQARAQLYDHIREIVRASVDGPDALRLEMDELFERTP
jgi:RNA polymerase sigma-70 factor (ECF subfamily)